MRAWVGLRKRAFIPRLLLGSWVQAWLVLGCLGLLCLGTTREGKGREERWWALSGTCRDRIRCNINRGGRAKAEIELPFLASGLLHRAVHIFDSESRTLNRHHTNRAFHRPSCPRQGVYELVFVRGTCGSRAPRIFLHKTGVTRY